MIANNSPILITGITSIHGWPIFNYFDQKYPGRVIGAKTIYARQPEGANIIAANVEDQHVWQKIFDRVCPGYLIHCGGLCDLDKSEDNPDYAYKLNVEAAEGLYCLATHCKIVYISYDLIFSGKDNDGTGYREEDIPDPLTVVGKTIVAAEEVFLRASDSLIIRLGLPLGPSVQGYKGAVDWIDSRLRNHRVATLLYDEIRSTINTEDLGPAVDGLMAAGCAGIYNLGSEHTISIHGIGEKLLGKYGYRPSLLEGRFRHQFPPSPPRMGNVSLNSSKAYQVLGWIPDKWTA